MSDKTNHFPKILQYTLDYFKKVIPAFKCLKSGKLSLFTCPICQKDSPSALLIPGTYYKIRCNACNKILGTLFDIIKVIEPDKKEHSHEEIAHYIKSFLKLDSLILDAGIDRTLDFYEKNGFDLVPIASNQKIPVEREWTSKVHKDKKEWITWLNTDKLNIGVKAGKRSNIIVLDIDQEVIPQEIDVLLPFTLYQKSTKGHHLFFRYTEELSFSTRIEEYKLDIVSNGKQVVIYPSVVEGIQREIVLKDILEIPPELLKLLKSKIPTQRRAINNEKTTEKRLKEEIKSEDFNIGVIEEGNRNSFLCHFGGILRKHLNTNQVAYALHIINNYFCKPVLPHKEVDTVINSLDRYCSFDDTEIAVKVVQYMKIVEEASARDIREMLGEYTPEGKQRIDRAIKFLIKEGILIKKRKDYHLIKKADWKTSLIDEGKVIDFKMPYFDDIAIFRDGDLIILGAATGTGKTHLSINIIKRLVEQGKRPYYISLESGARFIQIALALGLKESDFKWAIHFSPLDIELEKNAITLIDWVLPDDYALTDKIYKHFAEQLVKQGGILIAFVQLMKNNEFFAKNMIDFFASFVVKFIYEDTSGENSYFLIEKIREPKGRIKSIKIPTFYNFDTKELLRRDESSENNIIKPPVSFLPVGASVISTEN